VKGTTIAQYKVLDQLGRGGMGVVWKGFDERLNRHVALKVLAPELITSPESRERLIREARAASQLDHPNICTIHEIEETPDGHIVLVMAYYEGETLSHRIRRGRFDLDSSVHVMRAVLGGLKHAHERGVVHRDIKPGNMILLPDGGVKIVDFGLAHATGPNQLTITQKLEGTVHYMEPEALAGEHADNRTDLWSCGVVMYEMLSGVLPFQGEHILAVLAAIGRNEPTPLRELRPDLPPRVDAIVARALAKVRGARYQSAGEFLFDLEHFAHATGPTSSFSTTFSTLREPMQEKSLVVLPFAPVGSNQDADFFSEGLTDEIITDLSGIKKLRVICRSSAMRLKGTTKHPREIAAELNVRYLLEGTVRVSGDKLRVNAQLIDPDTDSPMWAEKYSGTLADVFSIQEELAQKIVEALRLKLTAEDLERIAEHPVPDIRAYEYYLRAKRELLSYSKEALDRALDYINKGEEIIGENVLLLSARGMVHWQFINAGIDADPVHLETAEACANRIVALQPNSAHGHRLLGLSAVVRGSTQEAVRQLKRSLELAPGDPDSMAWLCSLCALSGKASAVTAMAKRLVQIDPLTPTYHFMPGFVAMLSGDFGHAIAPYEDALRGEPENQMLRLAYAQALMMSGDKERAIETLDALAADDPGGLFTQLGLALRSGMLQDLAGVRGSLPEEVAGAAAGDLNYSWLVAQAWALAGDVDESLHWLKLAIDHGFINYPMLSRFDPTLVAVRQDERFANLLETARVAWEAFEV
jgi:serine/threonine protein kinase/predicted Zn-dependent protease